MRRSILIVDDEATIRFALAEYFATLGYDATAAAEREEAEALLSVRNFDLLVTDLRLTGPGGTQGLDLVSFARRTNPALCTILLTAYGNGHIEREARALGADAFLQKPIPLSELGAIAASVLEKSRS